MATPDRKVRKSVEEYGKTGVLKTAALRADMDEKTARKYLRAGKLPSEMQVRHTWRTREDPFEEHWPDWRDAAKVWTAQCSAVSVIQHALSSRPAHSANGRAHSDPPRMFTEYGSIVGPICTAHLPGLTESIGKHILKALVPKTHRLDFQRITHQRRFTVSPCTAQG